MVVSLSSSHWQEGGKNNVQAEETEAILDRLAMQTRRATVAQNSFSGFHGTISNGPSLFSRLRHLPVQDTFKYCLPVGARSPCPHTVG